MEIQQSEKEFTKTEVQIPPSISKDLKEIKTLFIDLYKKDDIVNIDLHSQFIETRFREVSKKLSINQRKVLKAYLDFQMEDASEKLGLVEDRSNRRDKYNFSFFPTQNHGRISTNQNKLLAVFKNWFMSNLRLANGLAMKKGAFLKELSQAQALLNTLFERMAPIKQAKSTQKKQKYCQTTLILILITQFNLCVFLLFRNNYSSVRSVMEKFKLAIEILKKQNEQKQAQILKNLTIVEQLHKEQEKQLKKYMTVNKVRSIRQMNSFQKGLDEDMKVEKELSQQEKINQKFNKVIDEVIEKNRAIVNQKEKIDKFLQDIEEKILKIENALLFESETNITNESLKLSKMVIKLFENQKLNSAMTTMIKLKDQSSQKPSPSISELLFSPNSEQDMFLSVSKPRKNLELSIKDYFNMCMFLKKSQINKEAIIYFEILVFHFRKKNLLTKYCLRRNFSSEIEDNDEIDQEERMLLREKMALKELQQFMRNEELLRIILFSLVNLIELYQLESAHYWAVQTLNYLSKLIEFQVINVLENICFKLNYSHSSFNIDDEIPNSSQQQTQDVKECRKLIKKYSSYLQEIKFRIIKSSFNSLTSQIINQRSLQNQENAKKIIISRNFNVSAHEKTIRMKTLRKTAQVPISYNMKRLQEKENQLHTLIYSERGSIWKLDKAHRSGNQTPSNNRELNKTLNLFKNTETCNIIKDKLPKGSSYQIKKKTIKPTRMSNKDKTTNDSPPAPLIDKKLNSNHSLKPSLKTKSSVKFHLSMPLGGPVPSCSQIKTFKSIAQQSSKNSVAFLDTVKTLDQSTKNTRMGEHRKKLLESKEELQEHIKLSFMKINSCIKGLCYSTESLDEIKAQTYDFTSQMDEVLHEFDEMLLGLKVLRSHSDETFQREMLIDAKVKLLEMVKSKSGHDRLIEMCMGLLNDINLMKNSEKRIQLKKRILWELSQNYMGMKETKKAISAFLQLARLGDSIGYLKIGELYMNMKDYPNSIKFHEKYAAQKNYDLSSKVKLAHAYSKVPQYYMKTIDMLSGILIAPGSSSKFKQEIYQRKHDDRLIESAIILLSSLHFKNQNVQKAIELCETYCKVNIKNHRVLHILGSYYKFKGSTKKAFQCYLNALQNNPTHHKSLIQLTQFICQGAEYKAHAIQLLRKCFCMENRNFELARTLVRFLVEGNQTKDLPEKDELDYPTLIRYAEILNNSHTRGYSGENFYQEALLVYEWALSLLDKSVSISNLDQVEQIYKNLGEICLKRGDYARSQSYNKLYLLEIEKYVSRSNISEELRQEKIGKTKMQIFNFLGKVKKHQHSYKKAIGYFNKSHQLQKQYQQKLPELESYFHFFEVGQCYFMLENYELALKKFNQHKDYLLYFINNFDGGFFKEEKKEEFTIEAYMEMKEKREPQKKINYLKQWINGQNQSSQTEIQQENEDFFQVEYILKKNYFQTEMYSAFCHDSLRQFIDSKEIYKKLLGYIKSVEDIAKSREKMRNTGKKNQPKEQLQRIKLNFIKHITANFTALSNDYKVFKKVSMINLANIYRIQGLQEKCKDLMQQCEEQSPQHFRQNGDGQIMINLTRLDDPRRNSCFGINISVSAQTLGDKDEVMKVFKTSLESLDRTKNNKKVFFFDPKEDSIKESNKTLSEANSEEDASSFDVLAD